MIEPLNVDLIGVDGVGRKTGHDSSLLLDRSHAEQ